MNAQAQSDLKQESGVHVGRLCGRKSQPNPQPCLSASCSQQNDLKFSVLKQPECLTVLSPIKLHSRRDLEMSKDIYKEATVGNEQTLEAVLDTSNEFCADISVNYCNSRCQRFPKLSSFWDMLGQLSISTTGIDVGWYLSNLPRHKTNPSESKNDRLHHHQMMILDIVAVRIADSQIWFLNSLRSLYTNLYNALFCWRHNPSKNTMFICILWSPPKKMGPHLIWPNSNISPTLSRFPWKSKVPSFPLL